MGEARIERERHTLIGRPRFEAIPDLRGSVLSRKVEEARGRGAPVSSTAQLALDRDLKMYAIRIYLQRDPEAVSIFVARRSTREEGDDDQAKGIL